MRNKYCRGSFCLTRVEDWVIRVAEAKSAKQSAETMKPSNLAILAPKMKGWLYVYVLPSFSENLYFYSH